MAYSKDFRERAIEFVKEGHTGKELYEAFKIRLSLVRSWQKQEELRGTLAPQYRKTWQGKIDVEKLRKAVERTPDITLPELAKMFDCTKQSVHVALKKAKITRKKRHSSMESNSQ